MQGRKKNILVAMSGGVDSSVVAALLKAEGHNVIGITMQIWQESQRDPGHSGCCSLGAVEDARRVARILDIPHYVMNFKDKFKKEVIDNFIEEYSKGHTPNPCVECNKKVKFEALFDKLNELGCDVLATGHYGRISQDSNTGKYRLLQAKATKKDQSYVLYMLNQEQMKHLYFPLGEFSGKEEIREIAQSYNLPVALKPDSQEICFVSEAGGYREFLKTQRTDIFEKGEVVHEDGRLIGEHVGVAGFTVGQRKGIGITLNTGKPLYVTRLDPITNRVYVGEEETLLRKEVNFKALAWNESFDSEKPLQVMAKIRYNMDSVPAMLYKGIEKSYSRLVFDEPVKAVTPGQIAVAYKEEAVVGGGPIVSSYTYK